MYIIQESSKFIVTCTCTCIPFPLESVVAQSSQNPS